MSSVRGVLGSSIGLVFRSGRMSVRWGSLAAVVSSVGATACGGSTAGRCGVGTTLDPAGVCVPATSCGPGTYAVGGECVPVEGSAGAVCGPGTTQVGGECVPAFDAGASLPEGGGGWSYEAGAPVEGGWSYDAGAPVEGGFSGSCSVPEGGAGDAATGPSEATSYGVDPAHDGAQPADVVASPLTPAWTATFTGAASYPLVAAGRVFVAASEAQPNVRALDLATGKVVWGPIVLGAAGWLAYDGGRVFALDGSGNLAALDAATGNRQWSIQVTGQSFYQSPPVAVGGLVYVNGLGEGGTTSAIDEANGAIVWSANTFDGSGGSVAVAGCVVYEAEACDQLSAFDATTGALEWFHSGNCTGGGGSAPVAYGGLIWERDWAMGNVIIDTSGKSAGSFKGTVLPALHGGTAFYVDSGTLSAVGIHDSTLKWSFSGDGQLCTSAVVAGGGGQVFVGSMSGKVYEIDEATGMQKSVSTSTSPVTCSSETEAMAVAAGHLLVPAGNTLVVY